MLTIQDLQEQFTIDGKVKVKKYNTDTETYTEYGDLYEISEEVKNSEIAYIYAKNDTLVIEIRGQEE